MFDIAYYYIYLQKIFLWNCTNILGSIENFHP